MTAIICHFKMPEEEYRYDGLPQKQKACWLKEHRKKMGLVKNRLSTMEQNRPNHLSQMSIESNFLHKLDFPASLRASLSEKQGRRGSVELLLLCTAVTLLYFYGVVLLEYCTVCFVSVRVILPW